MEKQDLKPYEVVKVNFGVILRNVDTGKEVFFQGDDAAGFLRELNRFKTNKTPASVLINILSDYEAVME